MALSVKQLLFRRGILAAAVTSVALLVTMIVLRLLGLAVPQLWKLRLDFSFLPGALGEYVLQVELPFVIGVFLCLWLLLPVAGKLQLRFVVTRAIVAALVGWFVLVVVQFFIQLAPTLQLIPVEFSTVAQVGLSAVISASQVFLESVALVVLFAIFQWHWLKLHPAEFEVAGILDV